MWMLWSILRQLFCKYFSYFQWNISNEEVRSSRPEVFCKKGVPRNVSEPLFYWSCNSPATLLKKSFWHRCFPVNFAKFLRKSFFIEQLRWPLLRCLPFIDTLAFKITESWKVETKRLLSTKYVLNVLKWELVSDNHLQMVCEWIACWKQEQLKWSTKCDCHFYPANQKLLSGIIGKSNVDCHVDIFKLPALKGSYWPLLNHYWK